MSTSVADIYASARAFSPRTPVVIPDPYEIISRVRADQKALFTTATAVSRDRFKHTESVTSSSGSSARTVSLSGLTYPLERLLRVTIAGSEVNQVDELDQEAELSPRYFIRGTTLVEVEDDWGASGTKSLSLTYAYGPTDLTPTGALTQTVTVPDEWVDLLVLPLALYLASKDPKPDAAEQQKVAALLEERRAAWLAYLDQYGGTAARRFQQPTPMKSDEKD